MTNCPACDAESRRQGGFILFCERCGHRWLNRSDEDHASAEAATFTHDYSGYRPDPTYVAAVTRILRDEIVPRVPPPGRFLDVGCGAGDLLGAAQDLGFDVEGIDISQASAEICRSRGLACDAGDFLTHPFENKFDLITMWDVAAHLRDPGAFFSRSRTLLTKRGILFVKTPAFGDLSVRLSNRWPRVAGTLLRAPSHNQYFDRESLTALFSRTGFDPEWITAGPARSVDTGGSLKRRLARRARSALSQVSGDENVYVAARIATDRSVAGIRC
jgi:SAM-dependent methyltransferase